MASSAIPLSFQHHGRVFDIRWLQMIPSSQLRCAQIPVSDVFKSRAETDIQNTRISEISIKIYYPDTDSEL